ncbi:MAG: hypothetical protein DRO13_05635 [Thermoprotei archaeon]|nr:MAG: hypothetical protein DRO13_05635 [Thermoprotei archaeon]
MFASTLRIKAQKPEEIVKKINLLLSEYMPEFYRYNSMLKSKKYYLKPVHIVIKRKSSGKVVKYYYYGRYWYRIERKTNGSSRIKWIYLGKEKPERNLPDPPHNPLDGLVIKVSSDEVEIINARRDLLKVLSSAISS